MRLTSEKIRELNNEALNGAELCDPTLWAEELSAINRQMMTFRFSAYNPRGLTLEDFAYGVVRIPPQFNMPIVQHQCVFISPRTGRNIVSDTSLWRRQDGSVNPTVVVHEILGLDSNGPTRT
jgi:hypothetical protein